MLLVFSYEHSKPKALVPLAWAGAVLAGMAAETLVTAGVKSVSKAVMKKKADDFSAEALKNGKFDFLGTNPYRNKDGSITLTPSANDRAKMAGLISGALIGSAIGDNGEKLACMNPNESYGYDTGDYPGLFKLKITKLPDELGYDYEVQTDYGFTLHKGNLSHFYQALNIKTTYSDPGEYYVDVYGSFNGAAQKRVIGWEFFYPELDNLVHSKDLVLSLSETLVQCGDLYYPSTMERVYPAPMDMSSTYKMPNNEQLENKPIVIKNVYAPSTTEGPVTWEEIGTYLEDNSKDFAQIMDSNIDTYLEKGDLNKYQYTIGEVNNYYTDVNYPEKIEGFNPPTGEPDLPVPVPDGENLPVPVDPVDRSLLVIAKESYQYLADTVKNSVEGLTAVTAGATGLITFLSTTMGWLPNEWIVMFSAAFGLGLFAFFFRR